MSRKKIQEKILEICLKIARKGEGGMVIFGDKLYNYTFLVDQDIKRFNIIKNPKTFEILMMQDGAVWVNTKGEVKGYGISLNKVTPLKNLGTRHGAGVYASIRGNKVFVVSEEDRKIKIFKRGKMMMQIDPMQRGIEKNISEAVTFLEATGMGALGTIGTVVLFPTVGISLIPGIIVFGGFYYIAKNIDKLKKYLTRKNL